MMDIKWASSSDHYYNTTPEFYKYPLLYPVFCLTNTLLINALSDFCLPVFIPPLCLLICGMLFTFARVLIATI